MFLPDSLSDLTLIILSFFTAVTIWLEYAKFAVDKMSVMPEGMEFPRAIFEKGIIACGLHVGQVAGKGGGGEGRGGEGRGGEGRGGEGKESDRIGSD